MTIGVFDAPSIGFKLPQVPAAVKARAAYINAHGGINGHPIDVLVCNDQASPNEAGICARKAVSEKIAAVVRTNTAGTEDAALYPVLAAAHIPVIGADILSPVAGSSPVTFGLTNAFGTFADVGGLLVSVGATKISELAPGSSQTEAQLAVDKAAITSAGAKVGAIVSVPYTAVDLTPFAAQATANGVDGISVGGVGTGTVIVSLLKAIRAQGFTGHLSVPVSVLSPDVFKALGSSANGLYALSENSPLSSNLPAMKAFRADMAKYAPGTVLDEYALNAWVAVWTFERVAATLSDVTASNVLAAMNKLTDFDMGGITPPLTTTKGGVAVPGQPQITRLFNATVTYGVVKNGAVVSLDGGKFHDPYTAGG